MSKSRRIVGIELGSENCKMVEAIVKGSMIEIRSLCKKRFIYSQDRINAPFIFLESFLKSSVGKGKEVVLSIGIPELLELKVQRFSGDTSSEQVLEEVRERVVLASSIEWVEDFNVVKANDLKVLYYGRCQKLVSDGFNESIRKTKNDFLALDFSELAIGRVLDFRLRGQGRSSIYCVIDIGLRYTRINTYYNGVLLLPREIAIGGESFTQMWSEKCGCSFDEAEQFKLESKGLDENYFERHQAVINKYSSESEVEINPWHTSTSDFETGSYESVYNPFQTSEPTVSDWPEVKDDFKPYNPFLESSVEMSAQERMKKDEGPVFQKLSSTESCTEDLGGEEEWAPLLEELIKEIKRSMDYAQSLGFFVDKLFLTGGGGLIKGLDTYISKSLHIACQRLNPFEKMSIKLQDLSQEEYLESAQDFSVAIGNILHTIY